VDDELLAGAPALVGVVLAGEDEGVDDARAVDLLRDLVGVLLDDREQVGQQLALDGRQVGGDAGGGRVQLVGAVDRAVARDRDRAALGLRPGPARDRRTLAVGGVDRLLVGRPARLFGGAQAACRIVSVVRYRSPSSSLRW
jgi:hypothetical protein